MKAEVVATFSERLMVALNRADMKAIDLSRITGIPKSSISQYLSGLSDPRRDRIYLIAQALDVAIPWLLGFDVPIEKSESDFVEVHVLRRLMPYVKGYLALSKDKQEMVGKLIESLSDSPTEGGDSE